MVPGWSATSHLVNLTVDLNSDLGEGAGTDEQLLELVSSANIACGFHAGDAATINATLRQAKRLGVAVGAHPSLADRENFGRRELPVTPGEVFELVLYQLGAFGAIANSLGIRPHHVKPHGALYNMAARDEGLARAVASATAAADPSLILFAPAGSALERAGQSAGLRVAREVFADRNYLPDGSLVPRTRPDALLHDAEEAAARAIRMLRDNVVRAVDGTDLPITAETICVHGDTPAAVAFARRLREQLALAHVKVAAPFA